MNEECIHSELPRVPSLGSRLFSFLNFKRLKIWLWCLAVVLIIAACIDVGMQTSILQSWFFTGTKERLFYTLEDGPSREIVFPRAAPFDPVRIPSSLMDMPSFFLSPRIPSGVRPDCGPTERPNLYQADS